jgi:hypothetical protein
VQHDDLQENLPVNIIDGKWTLTTFRGNFSGRVSGGEITYIGDNKFFVNARLRLSKGGKGEMIVSGELDHNDFPPTFDGNLSQP